MSSTTPNEPSEEVPAREELIDFSALKPLNDPTCDHEFIREPEEDIPGTYTEVCCKCPVGRIVRLPNP